MYRTFPASLDEMMPLELMRQSDSLCEGALVIIDAVEGVCIQTHAVLKVAWAEGVRPLLIINKASDALESR